MDERDSGRAHAGNGDVTTMRADGSDALETVVARLRVDNEGLRTSLRHRAVIEQAKGVLIARTGCSPDQAFERLVRHSQHSNQKLVRVAAAVVGAAVTARAPVALEDGFDLTALFAPSDDGHESTLRRADERLAGVALEAAIDLHELAQVIAFEAALDLGPEAVLLAAIEPDGALRLVAGVGYEGQMMSAWHRIPPTVDVPLVAAARGDQLLAFPDVAARVASFPATAQIPTAFQAQVSVPLRANGGVVGVLGMSWPEERTFDDVDEARLRAIADQAVGPFLRLLRAGGQGLPRVAVEAMHTRWFRAMLDALLAPAFLLSPIRGADGGVEDFEVVYVNREALGDTPPDRIVGQSVMALYPRTVSEQMLEVARRVLDTGMGERLDRIRIAEGLDSQPRDVDIEVSVARLGDGLIASWRYLA